MLTLEEVQKIARLSKLALTEADEKRFQQELGDILGFVEKLGELDLKNVEATSHAVQVTDVFRADAVVNSDVKEKALHQAPDRDEDFFRVPKVL